MEQAQWRNVKLLLISGCMLILAALTPWLLTGAPSFFGVTAFSVPTGSMSPEIPPGSLAYVSEGSLSEGDVAAFYSMDGRVLVLHRVIDIDMGARTMATKGDANLSEDPVRIPFRNIVGKLLTSVPYLGTLSEIVAAPAGRACRAMAAGAGAMLIVAAWTICREPDMRAYKTR